MSPELLETIEVSKNLVLIAGTTLATLKFFFGKGLSFLEGSRKDLIVQQEAERKTWQEREKKWEEREEKFLAALQEMTEHLHDIRTKQEIFEAKLVSTVANVCKHTK